MDILSLEHIKKHYPDQQTAALTLDSLTVGRGRKIGIAGETGSGKSTLLRVMGGLQRPDEGKVIFEGKSVYGALDKLIPGHPGISYLAQDSDLPKFITVKRHFERSLMVSEAATMRICDACEITDLLPKQDIRELSGGERQRVALAKLLTQSPRLLLLDEPFSNLDQPHKSRMKQVLDNIESSLGTTMVMISHDPKDLLPWSDEILVLRKGKLVQKDTPQHIYRRPKDEYVAGLFGMYNMLEAREWARGQKVHHQIEGKYLSRPEDIRAVLSGGDQANGHVQSVHFEGEFDRIRIKMSTAEVITYAAIDSLRVGDPVKVSLR